MKNIEKFQQIKELNRLRSEYHKNELVDLVTFSKGKEHLPLNIQNAIELGKNGYNLYSLINSLFSKKQ